MQNHLILCAPSEGSVIPHTQLTEALRQIHHNETKSCQIWSLGCSSMHNLLQMVLSPSVTMGPATDRVKCPQHTEMSEH